METMISVFLRGKRAADIQANGLQIISDHAMAANDEMKALAIEFKKLRESIKTNMPNWIELEQYLL